MSKEKSNLYLHAKRELELAGMFDKDADYNGELAPTILEVVDKFSSYGHSGGSAMISIQILEKLLRWENLTPLTDNPDEWMDISDMQGGKPGWQNRRNSTCFSEDGGKTYYNINEKKKVMHTANHAY